MNAQETRKRIELTPSQLATLGGGEVGYIREIGANDAVKLLGSRVNVPKDARLYCLYAADGTPMSISGSFDAALANALEHELRTLSVH